MADLNLSRQYLYNGVRYGPGPMSSDDEELVGALVAGEANAESENVQRKQLQEQYGPAGLGHDYTYNFGTLAPVEAQGSEVETESISEDDQGQDQGDFDVDPDSPTFGQRVAPQ